MTTPSILLPNIPILDPLGEMERLYEPLMIAIGGVLRSGAYIMGPNVGAFESEVAGYLGVKHAIGVNSGTDALVIALRALELGVGDEVITTPFTFFATAEAIAAVGATPVFVDIDPRTFNIDPKCVEAAITPRTKAIIPVHLYGHGADMGVLMHLAKSYGLAIVEDVAQAMGATFEGRKLGTIGNAGAFSFFPTKNLGTYGDGGLIATNDDVLADSARMLRTHGSRKKYYNERIGYNSRLDELHAAMLRVKLPHLDRCNTGRRRVAARYGKLLADIPGLTLPVERPGMQHVFHQYTVRIQNGVLGQGQTRAGALAAGASRRDAAQRALAEAGIATMVYYPVPVHQLPVFAGFAPDLPYAEAATAEVLSLPIWPDMPDNAQVRVAEALAAALS